MKDLTAYAIREREKNLLGDSSENSFDKALQDFIEPVLDKVLKDLEYAKFSRI